MAQFRLRRRATEVEGGLTVVVLGIHVPLNLVIELGVDRIDRVNGVGSRFRSSPASIALVLERDSLLSGLLVFQNRRRTCLLLTPLDDLVLLIRWRRSTCSALRGEPGASLVLCCIGGVPPVRCRLLSEQLGSLRCWALRLSQSFP